MGLIREETGDEGSSLRMVLSGSNLRMVLSGSILSNGSSLGVI